MRGVVTLLFAFAIAAAAANIKLYFKDGSDQLVREYQVAGDRIRFYSLDRDDWEEVPASLVDLDKTKSEIQARAEARSAEAAAQAAEDKAERDARKEVASVPADPGVYLIEEQADGTSKLTPFKI